MFLDMKVQTEESTYEALPLIARYVLGVLIFALCLMLVFVITDTEKAAPALAGLVTKQLQYSGVENPVTAVLLNFRSYDTLLEIAVLMVVAVAMLPLRPLATAGQHELLFIDMKNYTETDLIMLSLLKWLVPAAIVLGAYLLWVGAYLPGGAFQASALIAGAGIALYLAGHRHFLWHTASTHIAITIGLGIFLTIAGINAMMTGTVLQYPLEYAGAFILIVEVAATFSISTILLLLFVKLKNMLDDASTEDK